MTDENGKRRRGRIIVTIFLASTVLASLAITTWVTHDPKMISLASGELVPHIKCKEVLDGRTLLIEFPGSTQTVRMAGLELPSGLYDQRLNEQAVRYGCQRDSITVQAGIAKKVLLGWVKRHRVSIIHPYDEERYDDEGHLLAYVTAFGLDVGRKLIQGGQVFASTEEHPYAEQYAQFQREAQDKQVGVWRP